MTTLLAIYRTADNGAKQVLVLTQFADTVRDMIDDSEDSAEWDSDAIEEEPLGSISIARFLRSPENPQGTRV